MKIGNRKMADSCEYFIRVPEERFIEVPSEFGTFVCFRSDTIVHEVPLSAKRERFCFLTGWLRKDII
ncbi:MAG: hypothetical protein R3C26_01535 [Calditrichia bacterium]